jgi:hypothetical protein
MFNDDLFDELEIDYQLYRNEVVDMLEKIQETPATCQVLESFYTSITKKCRNSVNRPFTGNVVFIRLTFSFMR